MPVCVEFNVAEKGNDVDKTASKLDVVLRTMPKAAHISDNNKAGVALVGGTLDLQLGHLRAQRGCVHHFHQYLMLYLFQ